MRVLVLGGAGFLGSHLCEALLGRLLSFPRVRLSLVRLLVVAFHAEGQDWHGIWENVVAGLPEDHPVPPLSIVEPMTRDRLRTVA